MKTPWIAVSFIILLSVSRAEDWTVNGKVYHNVTVSKVEPDQVSIMYDGGTDTLSLTDLTPELKERFHYDPKAAEAATMQRQVVLEQSIQSTPLSSARARSNESPSQDAYAVGDHSDCARVGEKEEDIIARHDGIRIIPETFTDWADVPNMGYGLGGTIKKVDLLDFTYSGFKVEVVCLNGISEEENIAKSSRIGITAKEAEILLSANSQGHTWKLVKKVRPSPPFPTGEGEWQRDDGAHASIFEYTFIVSTKVIIDARQAAYEAKHTTNLQGF